VVRFRGSTALFSSTFISVSCCGSLTTIGFDVVGDAGPWRRRQTQTGEHTGEVVDHRLVVAGRRLAGAGELRRAIRIQHHRPIENSCKTSRA
jgi:hypothetical protein